MGCASSSPVVNGEGVTAAERSMDETMADKAKSATNNIIEGGEQILNDAGEAISDTMEAVEDTVTDAVTSMKDNMNDAMTSGMAFMKGTSNAVTSKVDEMGADLKEAGNDMMKHVPLKDHMEDAVEDLMAEKMNEADAMANEFMTETEDMVHDMGNRMGKAMTMVGLPKVSNSSGDGDGFGEGAMMMQEEAGKISSKTPIQSMDSFKSGSPEPELQKLEEMSQRGDSPKPSNMLELVDLEATPTPMQTNMMMMSSPTTAMSEVATNGVMVPETQIDDSHTIDTNNNNLLPLLTGISTPADTLLLGEVIQNEEARLVDGVALSEPTQWEKFADSIVKTHLDKALRRGGGATSAVAAASTSNGSGGKDEDNHVTEQNIEL